MGALQKSKNLKITIKQLLIILYYLKVYIFYWVIVTIFYISKENITNFTKYILNLINLLYIINLVN